MASPTGGMNIQAFREMNLNSLDVLTKALQRLKELRSQAAANPRLEDRIEAEISTVELELRIATIVHTRLQAANIVVKPLPEEDAQRLGRLASTIDETIERDAAVSASLDAVMNLVATAKQVRDLVKTATEA